MRSSKVEWVRPDGLIEDRVVVERRPLGLWVIRQGQGELAQGRAKSGVRISERRAARVGDPRVACQPWKTAIDDILLDAVREVAGQRRGGQELELVEDDLRKMVGVGRARVLDVRFDRHRKRAVRRRSRRRPEASAHEFGAELREMRNRRVADLTRQPVAVGEDRDRQRRESAQQRQCEAQAVAAPSRKATHINPTSFDLGEAKYAVRDSLSWFCAALRRARARGLRPGAIAC